MPSLRDIRKRIRSVKNTQQITKAMKMVAAAKLRKAQEAILAARPYAQLLEQMIADVAAAGGDSLQHELLTPRPNPRKVEVLVLTSDRGLAGGFNANITRRAARFLYENERTYESIRFSTIGRKGNEFFKRRENTVRKDYPGFYSQLSYAKAQNVAQELSRAYLDGEVDAVYVLYNEFVSAISQKVTLTQLLPFQTKPAAEEGKSAAANANSNANANANQTRPEFEFEPSAQGVLNKLVPQALGIKIYRAVLESVASEHGSRMSAMENATTNAADAIGRLTLTYNRTRQAVITKELMEIVSGAEALK